MADAPAAELAARVRTAFPDLRFSRFERIEKGEDHQVLVLDGRYVFRFPRHPQHPTGLKLELAVLAALNGRCALPCPDYRFVAPDGAFGGYELIDGVELTPGRFAALSRTAQERVLEQVAGFLSAMHGLTIAEVETRLGGTPEAWPRCRTPADQVADGRERRLGAIRRAFPGLVPGIEGFYARFERQPGGAVRLNHSDVTCDHLLLAPSGDRLAGLIDFGDVEIGDPAYDFGYLPSYGDGALGFVFERYAFRNEDPGLVERARWQFVRYRIARLGEAIDKGWTEAAAEIAADLPGRLAAL